MATTTILEKTTAMRARSREGFTLLEILLVLALIVLLLGGLASLVRVFTMSYDADERRVGRAQLARSISQMLEEDLGSAVQDPIQAVADDANRRFIRHFGLRGDERSLQIDVVQPNLFATTATADENRRVLAGGDKSTESRQVPELKTIFYEFTPINAVEKEDSSSRGSGASASGADSGEDLGSELSGSLTTGGEGATVFGASGSLENSLDDGTYLDGTRPLAQKFGLSRKELDFETPDENEQEDQSTSGALGTIGTDGSVSAGLSGSLTSPPDAQNSTLTSSDNSINDLFGTSPDDNVVYKEPMTAAQIAMDSDDGTSWAPEVLDCRFSYFDGNEWRDSWDSIEQKGLPIAIKVDLKLAPLDDVDLYRNSPLIFSLPTPPDLETLSKLRSQILERKSDGGADVSRIAGSLTQVASGEMGEPVDVFNSYRPLSSIRAALEGIRSETSNASAFSEISYSSALAGAFENEKKAASSFGETDAENSEFDFGGATGGSLTPTPSGSSSLGGSLSEETDVDPAVRAIQEALANGAVYNETGVCVDYSNDGSYVTLEQIASEIGVAEPIVYEVIAYLPTTPLSRATSVERRRPAVVREGTVSQRRNPNANSSRERRAQGQNPYATGRARRPRERTANERTLNERGFQERNRSERRASERGAENRQAAERGASNRGADERGSSERVARGRGANERTVRERFGANGGRSDETEDTIVAATPRVETPRAPELPPANVSPSPADPGLTGGLGGGGEATVVQGLDPFAIVDQDIGSAPFASSSSEFDPIGDLTAPGLIETPMGETEVVSPTGRARGTTSNQQTWIRGKR